MIAARQAQAFLTMLLCGAGCALAHDAVRLAGWLLGGRKGFSALMDLLLGALLAVGMTLAGLSLGLDPMRLYLFAGVGLGVVGWYATGGLAARKFCAFLRSGKWRKESCGGHRAA